MKRIPLLPLLISLSLPLVAQRDSVWTKDLKEIAIEAQRIQIFSNGNRVEAPDSFLKAQLKSTMLSSLLDATSGIVIRSYGPGILATSSFRGGNAQQTAITWSGLSINNPVNGLCDFNLIPSFLFDDVNVLPGLTSSLQGSGAISGGINLSSHFPNKVGYAVEALQSLGSFGSFSNGLRIEVYRKKWKHSSRIFGSSTQNNYPFINYSEFGNPTQMLSNAACKVLSAVHETSFHNLKSGTFKASYWGSIAQRQIPPTMLNSVSDAYQFDKIHRIKLQWDKAIKNVNLKCHSYFQTDHLRYNESAIDINSLSKSFFYTNDLEMRAKLLNNSKTGLGIIHTYAEAHISNILPSENTLLNSSSRNLVAFWLSHTQKIPKLRTILTASVRKEILNAKALPFIPTLGLKTSLTKNFEIYGQCSRVFRFPTLNDLYWIPGGNPNLKAESGWAQELTTEFHQSKNKIFYSLSLTGFNRKITNWIQWQPINSQIWSPINIGFVKSSGLELRSSLNAKFTKKTSGRAGLGFDYTVSQNLEINQPNFKKQLIYIPFLKSNGFATLIYKNSGITFQGLLVGKRFTSSDNLDSLPQYCVFNILITQTVHFKKQDINLYFKVNNLLNKPYEAIIWRPMPGINFEIGVTVVVNHLKPPLLKNN